MDSDLRDKVAIVTGCSNPGGIGRAIAEVLATDGMRLVVHAGHNESGLKETARGIGAKAVVADIGRRDGVQKIIQRALDEFGRLDVMVNNAAVFYEGPTIEMTEDDWDQLMAVNLRGTFLCCQQAARAMMGQRDGGSIINISSLGGQLPVPQLAAYCASKGAIDALTRALACEWSPKIRVNAVAPGHMNTPDNVRLMNSSAEHQRRFSERILMGELGEVKQVGHAVAYLASERSRYVTGQVITLDGGLSAWQGRL